MTKYFATGVVAVCVWLAAVPAQAPGYLVGSAGGALAAMRRQAKRRTAWQRAPRREEFWGSSLNLLTPRHSSVRAPIQETSSL